MFKSLLTLLFIIKINSLVINQYISFEDDNVYIDNKGHINYSNFQNISDYNIHILSGELTIDIPFSTKKNIFIYSKYLLDSGKPLDSGKLIINNYFYADNVIIKKYTYEEFCNQYDCNGINENYFCDLKSSYNLYKSIFTYRDSFIKNLFLEDDCYKSTVFLTGDYFIYIRNYTNYTQNNYNYCYSSYDIKRCNDIDKIRKLEIFNLKKCNYTTIKIYPLGKNYNIYYDDYDFENCKRGFYKNYYSFKTKGDLNVWFYLKNGKYYLCDYYSNDKKYNIKNILLSLELNDNDLNILSNNKYEPYTENFIIQLNNNEFKLFSEETINYNKYYFVNNVSFYYKINLSNRIYYHLNNYFEGKRITMIGNYN